MTIPVNSTPRKLRYPLTKSSENSPNGTPQNESVPFLDLSQWATNDSTERVRLVFDWSLDEFVAMATAIDVGRDIAYDSDSGIIWWTWIRGLTSMSICNDVAECITNNTGVQNALIEYLTQSGAINASSIDPDTTTINDRMPQSVQASNISADPAGCDLDILWAGIREMITRLDDGGRTLLETAVVINDQYERYVSIIDIVPVIGDLAADLSNLFTEVIPDIKNSFDAYSSVANMDAIACTLFELACSECRYPTFEEVANTIAQSAFGGLASWETMSLATVITTLTQTGSFTPSLVWHTVLLLEVFTLYVGSRFAGANGSKALTQFALLGEDVPSDDWILLCDGCTPPAGDAWQADFTVSLDDWQVLTGTLTAAGVESAVGGQPESIDVLFDGGAAWVPQGIRATYERSSDGSISDDTRAIQWTDESAGTGRDDWFGADEPPHAYQSVDFCYDSGTPSSRQQLAFYLRDNNAGNTMILKSITLYPPPPNKVANTVWAAC